jgi:hypothetical protein
MRQINRSFTLLLVCAFSMAFLVVGTAEAGRSKKWRANNHITDATMPDGTKLDGYKVKVFWTADGCAGVKPRCKTSDGDVLTVCKAKTLQPGESSSYKFDDGTSNRKKQVCGYTGNSKSERIIRATSDRTKNGIRRNDSDGAPEWYND